jgi:hypothetical protein
MRGMKTWLAAVTGLWMIAAPVWALPIDSQSAAHEAPAVDRPVALGRIAAPNTVQAVTAPAASAPASDSGLNGMLLTSVAILLGAGGVWTVLEKRRRAPRRHRRRGHYKVRA